MRLVVRVGSAPGTPHGSSVNAKVLNFPASVRDEGRLFIHKALNLVFGA